jgi:hypothetical protein
MNYRSSAMWSKTDSEVKDIPRKSKLKWNTALSGCYEAPSNVSLQRAGYLLSDKKFSIIATLHFDVIIRRIMALSLERIIWYDFNGFLHIEIFVEEPFFPAKKLLDERWEEVHMIRYSMHSTPPCTPGTRNQETIVQLQASEHLWGRPSSSHAHCSANPK